jgi:phage recombination protein Bet
VLKEQIAPGASDAELDLFATVCKRTRLDPFAKQIWSIQRRRKEKDARGNESWRPYQVIQIGVHGLRLIAQRSREYGGQRGPLFSADGVTWTEVWLDKEPPKAAKVGVLRKGFPEPVWSVAVWDRAVQKDSNNRPMALWATRGPEQLALAAERDALRRVFPIETAEVEVVVDDAEQQRLSQRYVEIFGDDGERLVDRATGEVLEEKNSAREFTNPERSGAPESPPPASPPSAFVAQTNDRGETIHMPRDVAIVEQAHRAAQQRDQDLAEIDRQRREEGLL